MTTPIKKSPPAPEITSHGVTLLMPSHDSVRKLKRAHSPTNHGHKVWPTTWLLIDYLKHHPLPKGVRVLDLACGWGLTGIFCAKNFDARVTWIDEDEAVGPYLGLQAEANGVKANFIAEDMNRVGRSILKDIDVVIGSDICFCDTLIDPIRRLISRAKTASVSHVFISDPGRWPFEDLTELYEGKKRAALIHWQVNTPVKTDGKILKVETMI